MHISNHIASTLWLLSIAGLSGACDQPCARLAYLDMYGPDETSRTVVINALDCPVDQVGLWVQAGPSDESGAASSNMIPVVKAGTCMQVGHPSMQFGVEFVPEPFGDATPWTDFNVLLGSGFEILETMTTVGMERDPMTPLRADVAGGWHEVAGYGGDCSLLPVP